MEPYEEFKGLLYGTMIHSNSTQEDAIQKIQILQKWVLAHLPPKLYHFSSCSDHAIENFKNNEIWGSRISEFNDPFECTPRYDLNILQQELFQNVNFEAFSKYIQSIKSGKVPEEIKSVFSPEDAERICAGIANIPDCHLENLCQKIPASINQFIYENSESIIEDFFGGFFYCELQKYISCFCESNTSTLMWGHYADKHQGFCLEYDFSSIVHPCAKNCPNLIGCNHLMLSPSIAPVVYSPKRFDATSHLFSIIQSHILQLSNTSGKIYYPDTLLVLKTLLTKSMDWSYEKEWRLFSDAPELTTGSHGKICTLEPTALYIGARMNHTLSDSLYQICREKGIPCFRMLLRYTSDEFIVTPVPYENDTDVPQEHG